MSKSLPENHPLLTSGEYDALAAKATAGISGLTKAEMQGLLKARLVAAAEAFDGRTDGWNRVVGLLAAIQNLAYDRVAPDATYTVASDAREAS